MSTDSAQKELKTKTGFFSKLTTKSRVLSSVFSPDVFTPSSGKEDIEFLKCVPEIRHTDDIDVYDVIFNLRMPDSVPKGALWTEHTDKEQYLNFYCNNKLHVKLFFKDEMIFSDTKGKTSCLISPPIDIDKATTTYVTEQGEEVKASGIYFAKYNELNKKINAVVQDSIKKETSEKSETSETSEKSGTSETTFNETLAKDKKKRIEFSDKLFLNLNPLTPDSPFKAYTHRYTASDVGNFIMSDDTSKEKVKKKNKIFGKDEFENYMQFDFNLNDYTINAEDNGVTKRSSKTSGEDEDEESKHLRTGDPSRRPGDSILLLLKKGEWFSIVFKNITIPLDLQIIPKDMVTVKLEIENSNPIGSMGPNNVFYRNFFCEYLLINIKKKITKLMKVRDFMFGYEDMVVALQSGSTKYASKLNAMNSLARMVLEYYVKYLNSISSPQGGFDKQYVDMLKYMSQCATETKSMFSMTVVPSDKKTELQKIVDKSKKEIVTFSGIFSRSSIIDFRNRFIQAIYRDFKENGLSKLNMDNIDKILIQMSQRADKHDPVMPVSTTIPVSINKKDQVTAVSQASTSGVPLNVVASSKGGSIAEEEKEEKEVKEDEEDDLDGGAKNEEDRTVSGGGAALSDIFGTENYNLMAPMCMFNEGTGLNNMVVRVSKKVVQHIDASVIDTPGNDDDKEITSEEQQAYVDIQVGDAIRFVYKGKITYAIVCGFKPGKKTDEKGNDEDMNMTDFRKTNMDIMASVESQTLKLTPEQFLSTITLRGIKYLTFEYNNDLYSFADWNSREEALKCRNDELKTGLSGKFTFSCDEEKIPLLPNGYRYPTSRKIKEAFKKVKNAFTFGSTEADIGKNFDLPEYSLLSYMTLDKVMTPLNFDPVIKLLKSKEVNNPNSIFSDLKKKMEENGLNTSTGCKDNTSKIKKVSLQQRKNDFIRMSDKIRTEFNTSCMVNGVINRKKAVNFIRNLYRRPVDSRIFLDDKGIPYKIVPQIVFILNLIPNNPKELFRLLILALSSSEIQDINQRRKDLGDYTEAQNTINDSVVDLMEGGAIPSYQEIKKAEDIIKYSINMVGNQGFIPPKIINQYSEDLNAVAASYNPEEEEEKLALSAKMVTPPPGASGMGYSGMGASGMGYSGMGASGMGYSGMGASGMVGRPSSSSNFLGNLFSNIGIHGASSASGMGSGIGNDSCGNNTSIVCNGDDLVVTVTLKLNELIASCVNPGMIQHLGNHHGNLISNNENDSAYQVGIDNENIDNPNAAAAAAPPPPNTQKPSVDSIAASGVAATSGAAAVSSLPSQTNYESAKIPADDNSSQSSQSVVGDNAASVAPTVNISTLPNDTNKASSSATSIADVTPISSSVDSTVSESESPPPAPPSPPAPAPAKAATESKAIPIGTLATEAAEAAVKMAAKRAAKNTAADATKNVTGGSAKNKNKSKKNKTKKRKNFSSKKIKFTKVKKL